MKKYKLIWGLLFLLLLAARLLLHQSRYKDDSLGSNSSSLNFDFDKLEDFGYLLKANCYIAYASNGEDHTTRHLLFANDFVPNPNLNIDQ